MLVDGDALGAVRERGDVHLEHERVLRVGDLDRLMHVELCPHEADKLDVPIIVNAEKLRTGSRDGGGGGGGARGGTLS